MSDTDGNAALGRRARSGLVWSLLNNASLRVLNVLAGLVIARVVVPEEFGVYAVGLLVMTILLSMNELGVSVAVVRWPRGLERVAPTAVSCALLSSAVCFAVAFAGAPLIAGLLEAPAATGVIRIVSFGVLLDGFSTIPNALLMREFQQRRRTVAALVGFLVGTPVGIALAASGWGAEGLACGMVLGNAVASILIYCLSPARPRPAWRSADARELVRIGLPAAATSLLLLAIVNVDYVVVSRVLDVEALGFYVLAFNVASWSWNLLSMSIRQVSLPAFARLAGDGAELDRAFARALTLAAGAATLGCVMLVALADPLVEVLYGERWLPAVAALQGLAVLGALRVVLDLCYDLLVAVGRAGSLVRVQLVWLALLIVVLPLGARWDGIAGVAIAHSALALTVVLPLHIALVVRTGPRLASIARAIAPVAIAAIAAAAVAVAVELQLEWPPFATLLGAGGLTVAAYAAAFALARGGREAVAWARGRGRAEELEQPVAA